MSVLVNDLYPLTPVYSGQQVRVLGENCTLKDEEDSKIGQVSDYVLVNLFGQFVIFCLLVPPHVHLHVINVVAQWGTLQREAIN